jgi:hypothetical protein
MLARTFVSPDLKREKVRSRSSREVSPSMYSTATPASSKRSATCLAWFRLTQKARVGRLSPRLSHVSIMSPVIWGVSIASASSSGWNSPARLETADKSGSDGAYATKLAK